jgi:V8-like Glu-specific endopeptidase
MVTLEHKDLMNLVMMLEQLDAMQEVSTRRAALRQAGLQKLLPNIQLAGDANTFVTSTVSYLATFGRITYDNEALGQFLNAMKLKVGVEQQQSLDQLLLKYKMMEPIAPVPPASEWKSTNTDKEVLEKIFGENTLRPIAFLARGLEVSRSVTYVSVTSGGQRWSGTGFMVTPKLAMTNNHVISDAGQLPGVVVRFNYQQDMLGRDQETKDYAAAPKGLFHTKKALDYTVFEVQGDPGKKEAWANLPLKPCNLSPGERINIIQHPGGQPKQISMLNNMVEYVGGDVLQYVTSTLPGSSGSPIFNDRWQVVGLHHAGGLIAEPTTGNYFNRNEGIVMSKILADLPTEARQEVDKAAQEQ